MTTAPFAHRVAPDSKIYVSGHRGLVGSAVLRFLRSNGYEHLVTRTSDELDLRDRPATFAFFDRERPDYVINAAARVAGIRGNILHPADLLSDNLMIQVNVLDAAKASGVRRALFLGSSCIYPKHAPQPLRESAMLTGALEPTNDAYAIAKLAGVLQVQALRRQYGCSFISAMPTNLYGPGDNFDLETSHVLAAMIRKMHDARESGAGRVTLWGTGEPRREFLHADDLASACLVLLERYDDEAPINVGCGVDLSIKELARLVAEAVGFDGEVVFDPSRPDGAPRKLLEVSRIRALGWEPRVDLRSGIQKTIIWYQEMLAKL